MKKIVAISDLHGELVEIPSCDILIIAGDICPCRSHHTPPEQANWINDFFNPWLKNVPAKYKVIVAGNHDWVFQTHKGLLTPLEGTYLENSSITLEGIKIYGNPYSRWFYDWAFNAPRDDEDEVFLDKLFSNIPNDTDIIVSHGPPYGYGDLTNDWTKTGSKKLAKYFFEGSSKLLLTGHIHEDRGIFQDKEKYVINCSILNLRYKMYDKKLFEIIYEKDKGVIEVIQ